MKRRAIPPLTKSAITEGINRAYDSDKTIEISDGKETGLKAVIYPSGRVTLISRVSICGKNDYFPVGAYPDISLSEAREIVRKYKDEVQAGVKDHGEDYLRVKEMSFNMLLDKYSVDVLDTGGKRSADSDRSKIRKYLRPALGDMKVSEMTEADVAHYLAGLDLKPSTRNRHLALFKAIFSYARRMRFIERSPVEFIRMLPETTSQRRAMSDIEFNQLIVVYEQKYHQEPDNAAVALLLILALTGLRLGEVRHLLLEDVDWFRQVITLRQTKNGKVRRVPVCNKAFVLLTELHQFLGDKGWVFPGKKTNNPVSEPRRLHKALCEKAGIPPYTIHELRHTFATKLLESGTDIHTVKDLLGHSTIKVTEQYLHSGPARYLDAVNRAMM